LLLHVDHAGLIRLARQFLQVFHKEIAMEKRILAVLLAAFAGTAAAQDYVTGGASGAVVKNGFGDCWTSGMSGLKSSACPPSAAATARSAPRAQLAQADAARAPRAATTERRTSVAADAAGRTRNLGNPPAAPGYVQSGIGNTVVTSPYGLCWHAGAEWTPDKAAAPCDAVPRASLAVPPVAAAPAPAPEPEPIAQAAPPAPEPIVIEKVSLSTDVLFGFNKAELTPAGQQKLDELAQTAQGANVEKVALIGHADRIGSEEYNKELSEKRAQAVADYLASKGVDSSRLQVEGRGESQPVTGDQCQRLGKESNKNQKLIACLQPDRRVDAELLGSRESTASSGTAPSATGSTSSGSSSSSSSQ
jgi:OOP family OmpA-OmpF porin